MTGPTPAQAIRAWPADRPLAVLWRAGEHTPTTLINPSKARILSDLSALKDMQINPPATPCGFSPGWIIAISYDLGRDLEPAAAHSSRQRPENPWPKVILQRADSAWVYNHRTALWTAHGDPDPLPKQIAEPGLGSDTDSEFHTGPLTSTPGQTGYLRAAERVLEYIRAGDIYQANLAHRLSAPFSGSARGFFADLAESADPWHGAYLEHDTSSSPPTPTTPTTRLAWCSASPELFLDYDPQTRLITTRPMKGTQPAGDDPDRLRDSAKEQAELAMIVDLMRNDLGRVAEYGSVRVSTRRAFEHHAQTVRHTTATVEAKLHKDLDAVDLIAACFPAGSITGAPKVRAMQIIDKLETETRGPWCGSIGFLGDDGRLSLNVAIRTATIMGRPTPDRLGSFSAGNLNYWAGAGLVADSKPEAEWEETMLKAEVLRRVLENQPAEATP